MLDTSNKIIINNIEIHEEEPELEMINTLKINNKEACFEEIKAWKQRQKLKFKEYLRSIEEKSIANLSKEWNERDEIREKQVKAIVLDLNNLLTKAKKKIIELETREAKLLSVEEEMKFKLNEVTRQIIIKTEENENFQKELKQVKQGLIKKTNEMVDLENAFRIYRKEVDDSPLSQLKMEINKKEIEIEKVMKENERLSNDNQKLKSSLNKLKEDMILMKKGYDEEKERMIKQRIDEIERLKFEIYNQKQGEVELNEMKKMKETLVDLKTIEKGKLIGEKKKEYKIVNLDVSKRRFDGNFSQNEIERLSNERNKLLVSGMYNENDKIILGIDNKIKMLLMNEGVN